MNTAARRLLGDLRAQARRQGRSLRWVALGNRGDEAWLRAFALEQGIPGDHLWFLGGLRFAQAARRLAGVERMFSLRYHGLVLGAAAGASVAGWGPDPKLHHLLADLGAPPADASRPAWQVAVKGRVAALRRRASENRRVLTAWLRKAER
jgi:polysaccharide pyruvyl transferase WcaK-like protein